MKALVLEPYAARLHWRFARPLTGDEWGAIFAEHIEALARRSAQDGSSVIGHIKGIAVVPDRGYIRVNLTASSTPADVETTASDQYAELKLDLNVLIYGLSLEQIKHMTQETAAQVAVYRSGHVHIESISTEHSHT